MCCDLSNCKKGNSMILWFEWNLIISIQFLTCKNISPVKEPELRRLVNFNKKAWHEIYLYIYTAGSSAIRSTTFKIEGFLTLCCYHINILLPMKSFVDIAMKAFSALVESFWSPGHWNPSYTSTIGVRSQGIVVCTVLEEIHQQKVRKLWYVIPNTF